MSSPTPLALGDNTAKSSATSQPSHAPSCHSEEYAQKMAKTVDELKTEAANLLQRSSQALHQQSEQIRTQALKARESALGYVQHEPAKALLIAAGVGAALVFLGNWIGHRDKR
ncbi:MULTISPECIES: hypothetical protein [Limnohabitans]|jgi:ElaB/YqjD/DUF883 family membrane-anchored ribosome-binding protein|nr:MULTISPECIES: hypothetical protein [Limnohabitans]